MQEEVFHEVADEFINFANDLSDDWAPPFLSAAIMYAAARYNAFLISSRLMVMQTSARKPSAITPNSTEKCCVKTCRN